MELHEDHTTRPERDTSYSRAGTGHHLRGAANKVKDEVRALLIEGALAESDIEHLITTID